MQRLAVLIIGVTLLMGCQEESHALEALKQSFCKQDIAFFPAARPLTTEDTAIQARYGAACQHLQRLEGFRLKTGNALYLCRTSLIAEGVEVKDAPSRAAVLAAFPEAETGDILTRYGFTGKEFAALLVDEKQPPLLTLAALKPLIASIDSAEAAMAWAYLNGILGAGYQPQALCHAASLTETGSGWSVEKAERFVSCKPTQWVSFTVNRLGSISITQETNKINPDGTQSVICID
jgi:hypothetical protein